MASLTIRNLDDSVKAELRIAAANNGNSMEEEARLILRRALTQPSTNRGLGSRIHARFAASGGAELDLLNRSEKAQAADLSE